MLNKLIVVLILVSMVLVGCSVTIQQPKGKIIVVSEQEANPTLNVVQPSETDVLDKLKYFERSENKTFSESLNTFSIEQDTLRLVNEEREKRDIDPLRWNEELAVIARDYSRDMATRDFFAHTNPEGKDIYDRLDQNGVFYIVAAETITAEWINMNVSLEAVQSWLKSPGHRSAILDLDGLYTDAGVGVFCDETYCYVTMEFAFMKKEYVDVLHQRYMIFDYLYDPSFEYIGNITVSVEISATNPVDTYVVPDKKQYDNFRKRNYNIETIYQAIKTKYIKKTFTVSKGSGVFVYNSNADSTGVNITIDYINS